MLRILLDNCSTASKHFSKPGTLPIYAILMRFSKQWSTIPSYSHRNVPNFKVQKKGPLLYRDTPTIPFQSIFDLPIYFALLEGSLGSVFAPGTGQRGNSPMEFSSMIKYSGYGNASKSISTRFTVVSFRSPGYLPRACVCAMGRISRCRVTALAEEVAHQG